MRDKQIVLDWMPSWHIVLPTVLLILVGVTLILLLQKILKHYTNLMIRRDALTAGTGLILRRLVGAGLWLVLGLLVLRQIGVNVDGLWTVLASTLAVIGVGLLAVWTMVSNVTASLFIWIWRPYEFGDQVEFVPDEIKGRVIDRSLMFTTLRQEDGSLLIVPNNLFFQRITRRTPYRSFLTEFERWEQEDGGQPPPPDRIFGPVPGGYRQESLDAHGSAAEEEGNVPK
ncbi:MAG: mechanosensitive ion channel [Acidithiobacillus sp.]|nr:mechanosensitive ion channel [Acidithiobacillus sp.]